MNQQFNFEQSIVAFNNMYGLPVSPVPLLINSKRISDFSDTLCAELNEGQDILKKMQLLESMYKLHGYHAEDGQTVAWPKQAEQEREVLTDMADWLGDLIVYCASEMAKWGLPLMPVLQIIMDSNMSKLGADGLPIVDESGKVQKGPNYWKPEPMINVLISGLIFNWRSEQNTVIHQAQATATEKQA